VRTPCRLDRVTCAAGRTVPRPLTDARFLLLAVLLFCTAGPLLAGLNRRARAAGTVEHSVVIGSGLEFEADEEQAQVDFPFLFEYGVTNWLTATVEPNVSSVYRYAGGSVAGFGELETGLQCEFLYERRYRPCFTFEGIVKWPTSTDPEFGTGKFDYSLGLILGKEFPRFDMDLEVLYTFVGKPAGSSLENTVEACLSTEWRLSSVLDLAAEFDAVIGQGNGSHSQSGGITGHTNLDASQESEGNEYSVAVGIAEHLNQFLKLEQGVIVLLDGSWQVVVDWELDFSGD
jgi:hypothetical protein